MDSFSPDGKEVYYGKSLGRDEIWAVPALGGAARRVVSAAYAVPSPDGAFIYYRKSDSTAIFRAEKSGLNEEMVYNPKDTSLFYFPVLLFPSGSDLLVASFRDDPSNFSLYRINVSSHQAVDLGQVTGNHDVVWDEPGKTVLFSRSVNGLTNIWKYSLKDRNLTQMTFGTGPDFRPMPDPGGRGIYYVNGKSSGFLTAYHVHSKESTDIVSEDAAQPNISPDGKRVMYITLAAPQRNELWVSDIDGGHKVKIATGESLGTGTWAPDNVHLAFYNEAAAGAGAKVYIAEADGSDLLQLPPVAGIPIGTLWSPDQKYVYVNILENTNAILTAKWSVGDSKLETFIDNCCFISAVDPSGKYLLGEVVYGEKIGIYEVPLSDKKCLVLLPGVIAYGTHFTHDGKSFLYPVASRGEVTIYRQPWRQGKLIGAAQVALKVPFAFPLDYAGGGYDFTSDLSAIVYARPGGHADLYLLSQK